MSEVYWELPAVDEKVVCNIGYIDGLTLDKVYKVVYRGDNHAVINDDNGQQVVITKVNINPDHVHVTSFIKYVVAKD